MAPRDPRRIVPELATSANDQDMYLGLAIVVIVLVFTVFATQCDGGPITQFHHRVAAAGDRVAGAPSPTGPTPKTAMPRPATESVEITTATSPATLAQQTAAAAAILPRSVTALPAETTTLTVAPPVKGGTPPTGVEDDLAALSTTSGGLFDTGSAALRSAAQPVLGGVASILQRNPEIRIEVAGHTDALGEDDANLLLSQQRADAVREFLIGLGTVGSRISAAGYGSSRPRATNATTEGRTLNRRIEFRILEGVVF